MILDPSIVRGALQAFGLPDHTTPNEIGDGHIHRTFAVGDGFILQCINQHVFGNLDALLHNARLLQLGLTEAAHARNLDPHQTVLQPCPTNTGEHAWRAPDQSTWRAWPRLPGHIADEAVDEHAVFETGLAFGRFARDLATYVELPAMRMTIPGFHDLPGRYAQLQAARDAAQASRARAAAEEYQRLTELVDALPDAPRTPAVLVHNDAKHSNLLCDGDRRIVIDYDTVMPGRLQDDCGDLLRSCATTAAEDEADLARVQVEPRRAEAVLRGFMEGADTLATATQREAVALRAPEITIEQAIRFLTDYLQGDRYYKVSHPEHNLTRARNQRCLGEQLRALQPQISAWLS